MRKIQFLFLSLLLLLVSQVYSQAIRIKEPVRFLALGDSYTIGQGVSVEERWPNQFVDELLSLGYLFEEVKIIAQTGWRTDNLQHAIEQQMPLEGYNLVSLLIGVNNQYQGGSLQVYAVQFEELLQQAISIAGGGTRQVFVLSIPDYAYTPYGNGNPQISQEIDEFNAVNRSITETYDVRYVDITPISRNGLADPSLVASDGLHPSGLQYSLWVEEILKYVEKEVGYNEVPGKEAGIIISVTGRQMILNPAFRFVEFSVFGINGKEVLRGGLPGTSGNPVSLEGLPAGLYVIRLAAHDRRIVTARFILI